MAVNFTKNQDEITKAWRQVTDSKDIQNWALFGYEGKTNNIKLMSTGSNGLDGLVQEFHCSLIQYAFCRVINEEHGINRLILINWQGESSPLSRKGLCASHVSDVANYFKGCSLTLTIRNDDEATREYLMDQIVKSAASSSRVNLSKQLSGTTTTTTATSADHDSKIGSSYKRPDIKSEISEDRKSFWERQEEEEKERLLEERKRAAERQAQFEKERKLREETEAKKLVETIKERDRIIEATRQATDRRESSSNSQPSSIVSANADGQNDGDDDERVGRRSELIRLERNQETLSLISKGLIKNKRAIFEQASSNQPQQQHQSQQLPASGTLARRASGVVVSQRLNTFKSLDAGSSSISGGGVGAGSETNTNTTDVEKLTNGLANTSIDHSNKGSSPKATIKREVETIEITPEKQEAIATPVIVSSSQMSTNHETPAVSNSNNDDMASKCKPPIEEAPVENGNSISNPSAVDESGDQNNDNSHNNNNNNDIPMKSPLKQVVKLDEVDELALNGNYGIKAKALYDYQAADNTEISFDPNDIIGFIEKVDSGWWQGSVITGPYKGQSGLFPSNYVEEL